jgi:hypothetical protein
VTGALTYDMGSTRRSSGLQATRLKLALEI